MKKSQKVLSQLSESDVQATVKHPTPGSYSSLVSGHAERFTDSDGVTWEVVFEQHGVRGLNIKSSVTVSIDPETSNTIITSSTIGKLVRSTRIVNQE
jgi:hypothetical protein